MSSFGLGLIGLLLALVALGQPLYVIIGGASAYLLLFGGIFESFSDLAPIIELTRKLSDNEVLLAIPFFVISGSLMSEGAIASRLIGVARAAFGWMPGGLAISAVMACAFFAAISGSSPVTVIAIGSIMYPAMVREGYREKFAAGLVTSAGSLGILIPPSIPMIVYAIIDPTNMDDPPGYAIARDATGSGLVEMFIAGIGPGILISIILGFQALMEGKRSKAPVEKFSWSGLGKAAREGFWSLMLPVIILGGIYSGVFTPTQAAAVSVIYAVVVEFFIHRSISSSKLPDLLSESAVLIGSLLVIMALSQGLNKYLELAHVADGIIETISEWELSPVAFLLIVNGLLLVVGCFMDILSAILIFVPLLAPVAFQLGIHPIHLAIVFIVNLEIGYLTPPVGLNLFVASTIFRKPIGEMIRSVLPFVGSMLLGLAVISYVPTVALGLVALKNGRDVVVPFPERHIPIAQIGEIESLKFLAGIADEEEESQQAQAAQPAPDPGRPLSIEELTRRAQQQMQQEAVGALQYETLNDILRDFHRVHSGRVRLQDLGATPGGSEGSGAP